MKTSVTKTIVLGCFGIAVDAMLSGCVEPYAQGYGSPYAATAYYPGYEVRVLPSGYRTEVINGSLYYHHNGTYYRRRSGGYVIVEPPRTSYGPQRADYHSYPRHHRSYEGREVTINQLPPGYRMVNTRNGRYYQHNDVYYEQRGTQYVVVNRPY